MRAEWIGWALAAAVVSTTFSIAVSGIFQGVALILWGVDCWRQRRLVLKAPRFAWFLAAFVVAVLISLAFSSDPVISLRYLPKPVKFILVPLMYTYMSRRQAIGTLYALLAAISLSSVYGLLQYHWLLDVNLLNRIRGFMSHWMTFSGQVMLGTVVLLGWVLLGPKPPWEWPRPHLVRVAGWIALGICGWALLLSYTRNAWLGVVAGATLVLTFFDRRWLLPAVVVLSILLIAFPTQFRDRLLSSFDLTDATVSGRIELLETGGRMIADHPLTGVGPMMVPYRAEEYRGSTVHPLSLYQHLHNSALQIAAELGLPALLVWVSLWAYLLMDLAKRVGRFPPGGWERWFAVNAICVLGGFLISGLLEYNYGDAELAILLLFFVTAPYVVERDGPTAP